MSPAFAGTASATSTPAVTSPRKTSEYGETLEIENSIGKALPVKAQACLK
jgi:hypothetical protein